MLHSVKTVARNHRFLPEVFLRYCQLTAVAKQFHLDVTDIDASVSTWYTESLVHAFREFIYARFLDYLKYRGYQPTFLKMEGNGFHAVLDPERVPDLGHFTSVNNQQVRLSFQDMGNPCILGTFDFLGCSDVAGNGD